MEALLIALGIITILFLVFLFLKSILRKEWCTLCLAVSMTWIGLLMLYKIGIFEDSILIGLLIGQSVVGILYVIEKRMNQKLRIFLLPVLLTLTTLGYVLLSLPEKGIAIVLFLLGVWALFSLLYFYQNNKRVHALAAKIIE